LADWFKTVFMEDSENGGKGEIQERNRTVVYLTREKVKREILSFWFSTKSDSRPVQRMSMDVWGLRGERMEWLCP
jgi:hypothetical protein